MSKETRKFADGEIVLEPAAPLDGSKVSKRSDTKTQVYPRLFAGKYTLLKKLGEGGMGCVYKARHENLNRIVAIKTLNREAVAGKNGHIRFRREAQIASKLSHPNAVQVYDFGFHKEVAYIEMEYCDGQSLREIMHSSSPLSLPRVSRLLMQICQALSAAHALQIVHRDLKPSNIVLTNIGKRTECAKVLDFGISKLLNADNSNAQKTITTTGFVLGSPAYLSPEQVLGQDIDTRSDIYSLGILAYELISGELPFQSDSPMDLAFKRTYAKPRGLNRNLSISRKTRKVLRKALDRNPACRYQSAEEFSRAFGDSIFKSAFLEQIGQGKKVAHRSNRTGRIAALLALSCMAMAVSAAAYYAKKGPVTNPLPSNPAIEASKTMDVQAGSFFHPILTRSGRSNAEQLKQELAQVEIGSRVVPERFGTTTYYSVQIGPFATVDEVNRAINSLPGEIGNQVRANR